MRFAAIADVHGNYLALEAVLADIRAQGISEIVNLGDMASGPLDARRTMDALMALDAVHVLGNHDRWLIDRPVGEDGFVGAPRLCAARTSTSRLAARGADDAVFRDQVFLCHATPADDNVYWLETVTPDGSVRMSSLEAIEKASGGNLAVADSVRAIPISRARCRLGDGRLVVNPGSVGVPGFSYNVPFPHVIEAGTPDARYAILELAIGKLARDLPPCAVRPRGDGGTGAAERRRRTGIRAGDGMDSLNCSPKRSAIGNSCREIKSRVTRLIEHEKQNGRLFAGRFKSANRNPIRPQR